LLKSTGFKSKPNKKPARSKQQENFPLKHRLTVRGLQDVKLRVLHRYLSEGTEKDREKHHVPTLGNINTERLQLSGLILERFEN
jgi:hypothetical protein